MSLRAQKHRSLLIGIIVTFVIVLSSISFLALFNTKADNMESGEAEAMLTEDRKSDRVTSSNEEATPTGRYVDYNEEKVADVNYTTSIIFFHAPWCPECRAYEKVITEEGVPGGVQILKADYDSATDLKKKYGITIQTSFVRVDQNGALVQKWVGYGKTKSVQTILDNLK